MELKDCFVDLPITIEDENDYISRFESTVDEYVDSLIKCMDSDEYAFLFKSDSGDSKENDKLIESIITIKHYIIDCFNLYFKGNHIGAISLMKSIIDNYKDKLVVNLSNCYAFTGYNYYNSKYKGLESLYLFKSNRKTKDNKVPNAEYMTHIPLNKKSIVSTERYSIPGVPCIYLAQNSFICKKEQDIAEKEDYCVSAFDCTELLNYKVIDLSIPLKLSVEILLYDSYRKNFDRKKMLKSFEVWPLIIACSFSVKDETNEEKDNSEKEKKNTRNFKVEYVIPQLLMQMVHDEIIGITYKSNKIKGANLMSSNIAIPILESNNSNVLGEICKKLRVTDSILVEEYETKIKPNKKLFDSDVNGLCDAKNKNYILFDDIMEISYNLENFFKDMHVSSFNKMLFPQAFYETEDSGYPIRYCNEINFTLDEYILRYMEFKKVA